MALAIDVTTFVDSASLSLSSITTPSFTTTATNEVLLAFSVLVLANGLGDLMNTVVTGAGLTWELVSRQNSASTNGQNGCAEIWRAFSSGILTSQTVTTKYQRNGVDQVGGPGCLVVVSFTGADRTGSNGTGAIGAVNGASAASGAPTASLTTTRANSWVFGVGNDWDAGTARTLGSSQTMVHEFTDAGGGDDNWVQRQTSTTAVSGTSVTINDTAPTADRWNLAICEVLPMTFVQNFNAYHAECNVRVLA